SLPDQRLSEELHSTKQRGESANRERGEDRRAFQQPWRSSPTLESLPPAIELGRIVHESGIVAPRHIGLSINAPEAKPVCDAPAACRSPTGRDAHPTRRRCTARSHR